jgi:hypothetical protein
MIDDINVVRKATGSDAAFPALSSATARVRCCDHLRSIHMLRIILFAVMFVIALPTIANAAKRVGLVIGNDAYANLPQDRQLKKAINDAKAMRDTLERDLGFRVFYGENADYRRMNALVAELETATEAGDIVFVFFSGHGVSVGAENYLMPSDVPKPTVGEEARLAGNSFGADALTRRLQKKGARAIFAVLDACRDVITHRYFRR